MPRAVRRTRSKSIAAKAAAYRIAAKWKRQSGHLQPPLAKVHNSVQARAVVSQLAFVNDQASFIFSLQHRWNNLIERNHFSFDAGRKQLQRQISGGEFSGDGNLL